MIITRKGGKRHSAYSSSPVNRLELMRVLMFVPFANIWVSSSLEAALGEDWRLQGADIIMVRCKGLFQSACPAIDEAGLSPQSAVKDRIQICKKCISRRRNIDEQYGFTSFEIESFLNPTDREAVDSILATITIDEWDTLTVQDLQVGKIAAYEFYLRNKLDSMIIPTELWQEYKSHLTSTLLGLKASIRMLEFYTPDLVVVHNELYGVNNVVAKIARGKGIPVRHLGVGSEVSKYGSSLTLFRDFSTELQLASSESWKRFKELDPCNLDIGAFVASMRFRSRGQSPFTYSSRSKRRNEISIRRKIGLLDEKPTLLFLTSSSDERFAADLSGTLPEPNSSKDTVNFQSIEAYLHEVIQTFHSYSDIQLIIRIHPRMLPNKREGVQSAASSRLMDFLQDLPPNVVVNWPDQEISLYEVAQLCNAALNISSSAGLELLSLGIPVGVYEPERLFAYPREFNLQVKEGETLRQYVRKIIYEGWSIDNVRNAALYRSFLNQAVSMNLSGKIPDRSKWSLLRILNGLDLRTKLPIPPKLLRFFESLEIERTRKSRPIGLGLTRIVAQDFESLASTREETPEANIDNDGLMLALSGLYKYIFGGTPSLGRQLLMQESDTENIL